GIRDKLVTGVQTCALPILAWLLKAHRDLVDADLVIAPDVGEAALKQGRHSYLGVETSEKIYVTYQLEATDVGGHSSLPTAANPRSEEHTSELQSLAYLVCR